VLVRLAAESRESYDVWGSFLHDMMAGLRRSTSNLPTTAIMARERQWGRLFPMPSTSVVWVTRGATFLAKSPEKWRGD